VPVEASRGHDPPHLQAARRPTPHHASRSHLCERPRDRTPRDRPHAPPRRRRQAEHVLDEEGLAVDATQVLAVVEVISPSNPNNDCIEKLADYPAMGIDHCLIVDPRTGTVEVHSEPRKGRYTRKDPYVYGDSVPFGPWTVETADFRRYGKAGNTTD
jgi:hypothetical protein